MKVQSKDRAGQSQSLRYRKYLIKTGSTQRCTEGSDVQNDRASRNRVEIEPSRLTVRISDASLLCTRHAIGGLIPEGKRLQFTRIDAREPRGFLEGQDFLLLDQLDGRPIRVGRGGGGGQSTKNQRRGPKPPSRIPPSCPGASSVWVTNCWRFH